MTPATTIQVTNAMCSWGVLEFDLGQAVGYGQVLDEMRETGYVGTDLGDWGFLPTDPAVLKPALDARGLALTSAFVPIAFADETAHAAGEELALRTARLLAAVAGSAPFLVLADDNGKLPARTSLAGRITPEQSLSPAQWELYCRGVRRVAAAVRRETGLRCVFHHHCAGYVETPWEVEQLMKGTDPQLLGLCFDTGHYRFGGGDPLVGFRQFKERAWLVHFKDCSPSVAAESRQHGWNYFESLKHGIFCELGKGDVNFPTLVTELNAAAYRGWIVVEQDVLPGMASPKECARGNREYLRRCGL